MQMNSKELIGDCRKRFDELQEEEDSLRKEIENLVIYWIDTYSKETNFRSENIDLFNRRLTENIEYLLQTTKSLHWKSFYNGWLEGRIDLTKDNLSNEKD